jgi:hypothetical protein
MTFTHHFTNRQPEIEFLFNTLKHNKEVIVFNFFGKPGIGKSWLAKKLRMECEQKDYPAVLIDIKAERECDYLRLVTTLRDQSRVSEFNTINPVIEGFIKRFQTIYVERIDAGNRDTLVSFGEGNVFSGSFSDLAIGGDIINAHVTLPEFILNNLARQMEDAITKKIVQIVQSLKDSVPIVIILDTFNLSTPGLAAWLWEKLVPQLIDEEIESLKIVICGHDQLEVQSELRRFVAPWSLSHFSLEDTIEYLREKRRLPLGDAETIYGITHGHPQSLGLAADSLESYITEKGSQ